MRRAHASCSRGENKGAVPQADRRHVRECLTALPGVACSGAWSVCSVRPVNPTSSDTCKSCPGKISFHAGSPRAERRAKDKLWLRLGRCEKRKYCNSFDESEIVPKLNAVNMLIFSAKFSVKQIRIGRGDFSNRRGVACSFGESVYIT